jgi:hypothetical protein
MRMIGLCFLNGRMNYIFGVGNDIKWIMPSGCEWYQIILPSGWDNRIPRMDCLPGEMIKSQEWSSFGAG